MTRYYLSGPMTGLPEFNYPEFNLYAALLRERGYEIVNPAENFEGQTELPRDTYIRKDVQTLLDCDAIIMLDGWKSSAGARLELETARQIGLKLFKIDTRVCDIVPFEADDLMAHQEAEALVHGARQADYGHPLDDFSKTALIWTAILGTPVTAEQVALCMVGVKLSREVNKPKRDNIVDAHGYLMTYAMVQEERERRNEMD